MSVPDWLQAQIAEAARNAAWLERRRGATGSYWHGELKRRQAAAEAYDAADNDDTEGQEQEE